jgi:hypothetical protein
MGLSAGILVWSFFKIPSAEGPSAAESGDRTRERDSPTGQEVLGEFAVAGRRHLTTTGSTTL